MGKIRLLAKKMDELGVPADVAVRALIGPNVSLSHFKTIGDERDIEAELNAKMEVSQWQIMSSWTCHCEGDIELLYKYIALF